MIRCKSPRGPLEIHNIIRLVYVLILTFTSCDDDKKQNAQLCRTRATDHDNNNE